MALKKKNLILTGVFLFTLFIIQAVFVQALPQTGTSAGDRITTTFFVRIINNCTAAITQSEEDEAYLTAVSASLGQADEKSAKTEQQEPVVQKEYTPITKPLNSNNGSITVPDTPLVLIYHTHATETYTASEETAIVYSSTARSRDVNTNVVAIGKIVCDILEKDYGIKTIHDTALHDYPSYDNAYINSLDSIEKYMAEYPSIQYAFDLHRDGVNDTESARAKYSTTVDGVPAAKIMMVVGLNHETSNQNTAFAKRFKETMDGMYPNVMLPITYRETSRFNQFMCKNGMLFEMGSNLSTMEEASLSAELLARTIAEVIYTDIQNGAVE